MWHNKEILFASILFCFALNSVELSEFTTKLMCKTDHTTAAQICDCEYKNQKFILQAITGSMERLMVRNCRSLMLQSGTFNEIDFLNRVEFENIENLIFESHSLNFMSKLPALKIKIHFKNVKFDEIPSFAFFGSIDTIHFDQCKIGKVRPYAVSSRQFIEFSIENSEIDSIESQVMKKIRIEDFRLQNTTIRAPLPARVFYDLTISDIFLITNCTFSTVTSSAFVLDDVNKFVFSKNNIERMEGEAIHAKVSGRISIENNAFAHMSYSAFSAIKVTSEYKHRYSQPMEFPFLSNSITTTEFPICILIDRNDFNLRILILKYTSPIDCNNVTQLEPNTFLRQFGDTIYFQFGKSTKDTNSFQSVSTILNTSCTLSSATIAIIATSAALILILIIAVTFVFIDV